MAYYSYKRFRSFSNIIRSDFKYITSNDKLVDDVYTVILDDIYDYTKSESCSHPNLSICDNIINCRIHKSYYVQSSNDVSNIVFCFCDIVISNDEIHITSNRGPLCVFKIYNYDFVSVRNIFDNYLNNHNLVDVHDIFNIHHDDK